MKHLVTTMIAGALALGAAGIAQATQNSSERQEPLPGKDGNKYVPYDERTGNESIVYFTRDLSAEGLIKAYEQVNANIEGRIGVKLHTDAERPARCQHR